MQSTATGINCTKVDCKTTASTTLATAQANGAINATATLADLGPFFATSLGQLGSYGTATLANLGTFLGMTLGQLLVGINPTTPSQPPLTLNDLVAGLLPPTSFPWQNVKLTKVPLSAHASTGGTDTLAATITVRGPTGYESSTQAVTVSFTLPPGFSYVAGSALATGPIATGGTPITPSSVTSTSVTFGGGGSYRVTHTRAPSSSRWRREPGSG